MPFQKPLEVRGLPKLKAPPAILYPWKKIMQERDSQFLQFLSFSLWLSITYILCNASLSLIVV